jgi:hypothetical protein
MARLAADGAALDPNELLAQGEPEYKGLLGSDTAYEDVNRFAENLLASGQSKSVEEYIEVHQRRVGPRQRKVLAYLMSSRSSRLREYARVWLELAGQESGADDFLLFQKYKTLEVPESARHMSFSPGGN